MTRRRYQISHTAFRQLVRRCQLRVSQGQKRASAAGRDVTSASIAVETGPRYVRQLSAQELPLPTLSFRPLATQHPAFKAQKIVTLAPGCGATIWERTARQSG